MKDIINLPYPNPEIEADFPTKVNRAAQFAPFAALTGYDAAVEETARRTQNKIELDEYEKEELNRKLIYICEHPETECRITCFIPDERKQGGEYITKCGKIKKIQEFESKIIMEDGTVITIDNVFDIEY